jgi:hypothetical protein
MIRIHVREVTIAGRGLRIYPVERALEKAGRTASASPCQMSLFC